MEGFSLQFTVVPIAGKRNDTAAEVEALLTAEAELKLGKSIRYRRQVLSPGSYRLRIETPGGELYYFVIESAASEEKSDAKHRRDEVDDGEQDDPDAGDETPGPRGSREKEGREKTRSGKRKKPSSGKEPKQARSDPGKKTPAPARIRALFRLRRNPRPTREVVFEVRPVESRRKVELSVLAGSTLGRARITFVEEEKAEGEGE